MNRISKIVIVRMSSIGDIILTTPFVKALKNRFPQAEIDFLVKSEFTDLVVYNPHIKTVISFDKQTGFAGLKELKKTIQKQKYDLFIDLHKKYRSIYLSLGSGANKTFYFRKDYCKRTLLILFRINLYKKITPIYERYFKTAQDLGLKYDGEESEVFVPQFETEIIRNKLYQNDNDKKRPLIVLCPGASFSNKKWKAKGFIQVANYFIKKVNALVVLIGGKGDISLCNRILDSVRGAKMNFAGKLRLIESAALLKESNLVITNDSGMLHLAQSQKKPVVSIFGPTTKELGFFPFSKNSVVVESDIECRPCTHMGLNKCPKKHFKCMENISAEDVIIAAEKLINFEF